MPIAESLLTLASYAFVHAAWSVSDLPEGGLLQIGMADVFVESPGILFTLCREGDVHVKGESPLVKQMHARWQSLEYESYELP